MTHQEAFAARITRINAGGTNTMNTVYIGMDDSVELPSGGLKGCAALLQTNALPRNPINPVAVVGAFGLGVIALAFAQLARVHAAASSETLAAASTGVVADAVVALILAVSFGWLVGMRRGLYLVATATGICVMIAFMMGALHFAPQTYAAVMSPGLLDQVLISSQALSRHLPTLSL